MNLLRIAAVAVLAVLASACASAPHASTPTMPAETLVIGNRPVGSNPFRLTGSSEAWNTVYNRGELARASMTINLEEYT